MSSGEESNSGDLAIVNVEYANRITEAFRIRKGKGKKKCGTIRKSLVEEIWKNKMTSRLYSKLMSVMFPENTNEVSFLSFYTIYKNLVEPETEIIYRALTICHVATIHEPPFNYEQTYEYPKATYKAIKDFVCDVITSYLHAIINFNMKEANAWLELRASNTLIDGNLLASYLLKDLSAQKNEVCIESLEVWLEKNEMYFTVSEQFFLYIFGVNGCRDVKPLLPFPIVQTGRSTKTLLALSDVLLLNSKLPRRSQRWTLAYILDSRSRNWETLRDAICGKCQTIIVIQDANGDIFGMYGSQRWLPTEGFFGNDACFIFTLKPDVNIYDGSGRDDHYQLFTNAGIGMGGSENEPGMFINWSLRVGTTAPTCITFNEFSSISRDLVFDIRVLELWVVQEACMKRKLIPKRDFYNTVVMWNRIGRHKAKRDARTEFNDDCWFPEENVSLQGENVCALPEILETEERHFETSNATLTGTKNIDDELLAAIKNRLAAVPPLPGSISFKPTPRAPINSKPTTIKLLRTNHLTSKTNYCPNPVSTNSEPRLENKATSTTNVSLNSKSTQSPVLGVAAQLGTTVTSEHPLGLQSAGMRYELPFPLGKQAQMGNDSTTYPYKKQSEHTSQPLQSYADTIQPEDGIHQYRAPRETSSQLKPISFTKDMRHSSQFPAAISPSSNSQPGVGGFGFSDRNSLSLTGVPDNRFLASLVLPSVGEESCNQNIHELSWTARNLTKKPHTQTQQQQLLCTAPYDGNRFPQHSDDQILDVQENANTKTVGYFRGIAREGSNEGVYTRTSEGRNTKKENRSSLQTRSRDYIPAPLESRTTRKTSLHQLPPPRNNHHLWVDDRESPLQLPLLSPAESPTLEGGQTVLAMAQVNSCQMCQRGSREFNLVCQTQKEWEVAKEERECENPVATVCCEDPLAEKKRRLLNKLCQKEEKKRLKEERKRRQEEERRRRKAEAKRKKLEKECLKREKAKEKACKRYIDQRKRAEAKNKNCVTCACCKCGGESTTVVNCSSATTLCVDNSCAAPKRGKKQRPGKVTGQNQEGGILVCSTGIQTLNCGDQRCPYSTRTCETVVAKCEDECGPIKSGRCVLTDPCVAGSRVEPVCPKTCCIVNPVIVERNPDISTKPNSECTRVPYCQTCSRTTCAERVVPNCVGSMAPLAHLCALGHGDAQEALIHSSRTNELHSPVPSGVLTQDKCLIDLSSKGSENSNKRYVPPCVLYLDCTKVKDLCVIIKDNHQNP